MAILDEALIRKRAEHNDGILPDLEEIALHQQEIEKIESLEQCCRYLKILLLQNNAIGKIENVSKLKELDYLNLALNNIQVIEGLEGCESLRKLDMTINFIDIEHFSESINNLKANVMLEDLYLTGNGCTDVDFYRPYVLAKLPMLKQLDGKLVNPTERILGRQKIDEYEKRLEELAKENILKKEIERASGVKPGEGAHTIENRIEMNREMAKQKEAKDAQERKRMGTEPKEPKEIPPVLNARGEIRQCNEGKYDFDLDDRTDPHIIVFELKVPKFMGTDSLEVDVNPWYVRVVCKEKLTQLRLPGEVSVDTAKVQRSKTTGALKITMQRLAPESSIRQKENKPVNIVPLKPKEEAKPSRTKKLAASGPANPANILATNQRPHLKEVSGAKKIIRNTTSTAPVTTDDHPEVPPLEPIPSFA